MTVGEIVAGDYRTADVFQRFGIDFCCNGNRSLAEICKDAKIDRGALEEALKQAVGGEEDPTVPDFAHWPLDRLADHIEEKHHRYTEAAIPQIRTYLVRICDVHGDAHAELHLLKNLFEKSAGELAMHMKKEELLLFPYIRRMVAARNQNKPLQRPGFGTIRNPVEAMTAEHDIEGERFRQMRAISSNYTVPPDGCNTYRTAFALMDELEKDLHLHIHLENNILFPRATALESKLANADQTK